MKKLLLTLGLAALTLTSAHGQGTINPLNGSLTKVRWDSNDNGQYDQSDRVATQNDGLHFEIYWGAAGEIPDQLAGTMTIGPVDGIMVGLPAVLALPGAGDAGTIVSLRVRAVLGIVNISVGCTRVVQVPLAPAGGPGTVVWSPTGGERFLSGLDVHPGLIYCPVPEPSTLALGGLACAFLLLRARKTFTRR